MSVDIQVYEIYGVPEARHSIPCVPSFIYVVPPGLVIYLDCSILQTFRLSGAHEIAQCLFQTNVD